MLCGSFISAARKKKSDLSSNSENSEELKSSSEETFIRTPKAIRSHESCYTPSSVRQSLLHKAIMGQKRLSQGVSQNSSPILIKVAQMAKMCTDATPNSSTSQISDVFENGETEIKQTTPVIVATPRKSILKNIANTRDQVTKDISFMDMEQAETDTKEDSPPKLKVLRRSSRKVRFESGDDELPKNVQPMTPYVP
ncbi:hypothetical protein L9F63_026343, partial [Diploptera punctata]